MAGETLRISEQEYCCSPHTHGGIGSKSPLISAVADLSLGKWQRQITDVEWVTFPIALVAASELDLIRSAFLNVQHVIVTKREELQSALAESEIALADAVLSAAQIGLDRDEAATNLDKARAHCRQIRAALVKLDRSEYNINCHDSEERIDTKVERSWEVSRRVVTTAVPPAAQKPSPARTQPPLLRQSMGLLALTLAYLEYFYIDVRLEIVSLPSVFG